jgi:small neutral amino acid transporter SnatA (MarC family)
VTLGALAANLAIVYVALRGARGLLGAIGEGGAVAIAKVASLFLAAIGVMMVRVGVMGILAQRAT